MIIWSRWGIVVFLFIGLGVLLGFATATMFGLADADGAQFGVFIGVGFMLSAALLWLFVRFVVGVYIDKVQPVVIHERLAEPVVREDGATVHHRVVNVVHPQTGEQIYTNPVSTFFFVPIRFWPYVLGAGGLVIFAITLATVLSGNN